MPAPAEEPGTVVVDDGHHSIVDRDPALAGLQTAIWASFGNASHIPDASPPETVGDPLDLVGAPARLSTDPRRRSGRNESASVSAARSSRRFVTDRLATRHVAGRPGHGWSPLRAAADAADQRAHRFHVSSEKTHAVVITLAKRPRGTWRAGRPSMSWRRARWPAGRGGSGAVGQPGSLATVSSRCRRRVAVIGVSAGAICERSPSREDPSKTPLIQASSPRPRARPP